MTTENMVEYDEDHLYKVVEVLFNDDPVTLRVPINTTWVIRERNKLYVTKYAKTPEKSEGYYDCHKREWVDYEHYDSHHLKTYLGKVSPDVKFETRCEAWRV